MFELQSLPWVQRQSGEKKLFARSAPKQKPETTLSQRTAGGCRMSSCFYGNKRDIATNAFYVVTTKF